MNVAAGVALCIISVVPLLLFAFVEAEDLLICGVAILLAIVAVAVFLFVRAGTIQVSFHKLLQSEDFSPEQKAASRKLGAFSGAYWCIVTAVFLIVYARYKYSFFEGDILYLPGMMVFGMIWVVAALLYAAIRIVLNIAFGRKKGSTEK